MNKIKSFLFAIVMLILISSFSLKAQKKLFPRPPLFGIPAKTLPINHWVFRSYWIYNNYNKFFNSTSGEMENLTDKTNFYSNVIWAKIRYGITNKLTAIVNVPYIYKYFSKNEITKTANSVGDVIGALLYKFYHNKKDKFLLSGLLFTKFPTGKSKNLTSNELPVGSGSFDYGAAVLPEKEIGKLDLRLSAFYLFRNKNNSGINLGDMVSFSWSTAYDFSKKFIGESTFYYKKTFENSRDNQSIAGSDTYLFQFIPGVQYRILHSFLIQFVIPITIAQKRPFGNSFETWFGIYYMI